MSTFVSPAGPAPAPDPRRRTSFVPGMVVGADDLNQEWSWLDGRARWLARDALGYGTLRGLAVTVRGAGRPFAVVSPGAAIDPQGRIIGVPVEQQADLSSWLERESAGAAQREDSAGHWVAAHVLLRGDEKGTGQRRIDGFALDLSVSRPADRGRDPAEALRGLLGRVSAPGVQHPALSEDRWEAVVLAELSAPSADRIFVAAADQARFAALVTRRYVTHARSGPGGAAEAPDEQRILLATLWIPTLAAGAGLDASRAVQVRDEERPVVLPLFAAAGLWASPDNGAEASRRVAELDVALGEGLRESRGRLDAVRQDLDAFTSEARAGIQRADALGPKLVAELEGGLEPKVAALVKRLIGDGPSTISPDTLSGIRATLAALHNRLADDAGKREQLSRSLGERVGAVEGRLSGHATDLQDLKLRPPVSAAPAMGAQIEGVRDLLKRGDLDDVLEQRLAARQFLKRGNDLDMELDGKGVLRDGELNSKVSRLGFVHHEGLAQAVGERGFVHADGLRRSMEGHGFVTGSPQDQADLAEKIGDLREKIGAIQAWREAQASLSPPSVLRPDAIRDVLQSGELDQALAGRGLLTEQRLEDTLNRRGIVRDGDLSGKILQLGFIHLDGFTRAALDRGFLHSDGLRASLDDHGFVRSEALNSALRSSDLMNRVESEVRARGFVRDEDLDASLARRNVVTHGALGDAIAAQGYTKAQPEISEKLGALAQKLGAIQAWRDDAQSRERVAISVTPEQVRGLLQQGHLDDVLDERLGARQFMKRGADLDAELDARSVLRHGELSQKVAQLGFVQGGELESRVGAMDLVRGSALENRVRGFGFARVSELNGRPDSTPVTGSSGVSDSDASVNITISKLSTLYENAATLAGEIKSRANEAAGNASAAQAARASAEDHGRAALGARGAAEGHRDAAATARGLTEDHRDKAASARSATEGHRDRTQEARGVTEDHRDNAASAAAKADEHREVALLARTTTEAHRNTALAARTAAEAHRDSALSMRNATEDHGTAVQSVRTVAEAHRDAVAAARLTAEEARDKAASARGVAEGHRDRALDARTGAEAHRDNASTARSTSEGYRDSALVARNSAEAHRDAALLARSTAESHRDNAAAARTKGEEHRDYAFAARTAAEEQQQLSVKARSAAEGEQAGAATARRLAEAEKTAAEQQSAYILSRRVIIDSGPRAMSFTWAGVSKKSSYTQINATLQERVSSASIRYFTVLTDLRTVEFSVACTVLSGSGSGAWSVELSDPALSSSTGTALFGLRFRALSADTDPPAGFHLTITPW